LNIKDKMFEALLEYLQQSHGFQIIEYKRPTIMRRVSKRMKMFGLEDFSRYTDYLQVHSEEFPELFNTILINVTSFFRDPEAWDYLAKRGRPSCQGGGQAGGKTYLDIERKMTAFSKDAGIPMGNLDLLLWYKEAGEVFK
jgi:hypothetical protein